MGRRTDAVSLSRLRDDERGAIAVFTILALPLLLLMMGLVIDVGTLFGANSLAYAAADMAALAAVQDLDLQQLSEGTRYIIPDDARRDAEAWLVSNILANWPGLAPGDISASVIVYNPAEGASVDHAWNGRRLDAPTVCVRVSFPVRLRFVSALAPSSGAFAHADASVVRKRRTS